MIAPGRITLHAVLTLALIATAGCERKLGTLEPIPPDPVVFDDAFGTGVDYQAFRDSKLDAVSVDTTTPYFGTACLRVTVPDVGFAGGAFTTVRRRDLSSYNALTFWARADRRITLNVAGLGNDNTGTSRYEASRSVIPVDTTWAPYTVPIPLPEKLGREGGLFFFAEGPENGQGSTLWLDEVRFARLGTISNPRPSMFSRTVRAFVGATVSPQGTKTVFDVSGTDVTVEHLPGYFTYQSSNDSIVTIQNDLIRVVGAGIARVTAKLGTIPVRVQPDPLADTARVTIDAIAPPSAPAPTPTVPAADVISLFSNAYTNVPVNTWSASWDIADLNDFQIAGNDTKAYTNMSYAGVEFTAPTIDATAMTHFHIDVWVPTSFFRVKLVDFGADGAFGGGDDREHELTFGPGTTPAITPNAWSSLDVPLADFTNLTTRGHLAQLILSGASTAFVDNVYFHK